MTEQHDVEVTMSPAAKGMVSNLGERLRLTRESKNIALAEVSQSLLISKKIIDALENNDYSGIVAPVYARGYLKSYAKFLQLPIDEVLSEFENMKIYSEDTKDVVIESEKEAVEIRRYMRWATFAIVAILVLLVLLWMFGQRTTSKTVTEVSATNELNQPQTASSGAEKKEMSDDKETSSAAAEAATSAPEAKMGAEKSAEKSSDKSKSEKSSEHILSQPEESSEEEINIPVIPQAQ